MREMGNWEGKFRKEGNWLYIDVIFVINLKIFINVELQFLSINN